MALRKTQKARRTATRASGTGRTRAAKKGAHRPFDLFEYMLALEGRVPERRVPERELRNWSKDGSVNHEIDLHGRSKTAP